MCARIDSVASAAAAAAAAAAGRITIIIPRVRCKPELVRRLVSVMRFVYVKKFVHGGVCAGSACEQVVVTGHTRSRQFT
jgi:hypothetical protein